MKKWHKEMKKKKKEEVGDVPQNLNNFDTYMK